MYLIQHVARFVYVGKSGSGLGVKERLINHYRESHNERLRIWIVALDGDLSFTYIGCAEGELDDLEKSLIAFLQPLTNAVRYQAYVPENAKWRKYYG